MSTLQQGAYLVGTHRMSFRAGTPARVVGVCMTTPEGVEQRLCFRVRFDDGVEDLIPAFAAPGSTTKNPHYEMVTCREVMEGNIPKVVH